MVLDFAIWELNMRGGGGRGGGRREGGEGGREGEGGGVHDINYKTLFVLTTSPVAAASGSVPSSIVVELTLVPR